MNGLKEFLARHGLEPYLATLVAEDIDSVDLLRQCNDADLLAMGFKLGARLKFRSALQDATVISSPPPRPAASCPASPATSNGLAASPSAERTPPSKQQTLSQHGVSVTRKADGALIVPRPSVQLPFRCPFLHCGKSFKRPNDLTNHKKAMHKATDPMRVRVGPFLGQSNIRDFATPYSRVTRLFPSTVVLFACAWVPLVPKPVTSAARAVIAQYSALTSRYPSCVGLFAHSIWVRVPPKPPELSRPRPGSRPAHAPKHKKAPCGRALNRGSKVRKCSLVLTRKKAIDKYAEYLLDPKHKRPTNIAKTIACWLGTNRVNVTKWWNKREKYWAAWKTMAATRNKSKGAVSCRRLRYLPRVKHGRYQAAEAQLHDEFLAHRVAGNKVSGLWLRLRMRQITQETHPHASVKATMGWLYKWCRRFGVVVRRRTAYKTPVVDRLQRIKRWHARLWERIKRGAQCCATYGRWQLKNRYNMDQVPCPFANIEKRTYHSSSHGKRVLIQTGQEGGDKRECTLQLCCRYVDNELAATQPRAAIIFRGKGLRIAAEERSQWDPRVDVYFQAKAWLNDSVLDEWVIRTFSKATSFAQNAHADWEESVLFCDNLKTQTRDHFRHLLWKHARTKLHLFPTGVTDELQTVDDGLGVMVKRHMGEAFTAWLENNLERMLKREVKASERRIVLTKLLADAWQWACEHYNFIKSGVKNGCCMGLSADTHKHIHLQGLEGEYAFDTDDCGGTCASSDAEQEQQVSDLDAASDTDSDGLEVRSDSDSASDSDESDDEHAGPGNVDDQGNFVAPEGMHPLERPPSPMTLAVLKKRKIMVGVKWPFGDEVGWEMGRFTKFDATGKHKGEYSVKFEDGQLVWFPVPPVDEYGGTVDKRWVLVQPTGTAESEGTAKSESESEPDHAPSRRKNKPRACNMPAPKRKKR